MSDVVVVAGGGGPLLSSRHAAPLVMVGRNLAACPAPGCGNPTPIAVSCLVVIDEQRRPEGLYRYWGWRCVKCGHGFTT